MDPNSHQTSDREDAGWSCDKYQELFDRVHHYNSIAFVLVLAKDVGILDALLEAEHSMTSQEIADSRQLKERYTREILDTLVCGQLFKASWNDNGRLVYYMDENARKVLTRNANQGETLMPLVYKSCYDTVKQCVSISGPIGVAFCDEFFQRVGFLQGDDQKALDFLLDHVQGLEKRLEKGIQVIEFGSGFGSLIEKLATQYPNSTFTASEVSTDLVEEMKNNIGHLSNVHCEVYDLAALPSNPTKTYDWVLMKNATHVAPYPEETLKRIRPMVTEQTGVFTHIDLVGTGDPLKSIGDTREANNYAVSVFCCVPFSLLQHESSEAHGCCWGRDTAIRFTRDAGFEVEAFTYTQHHTLFVAKPI